MQPTDGGDRLLGGRYRLGALLGRGGMAEVYDGFDERLSRPVAVKLLRNNLADPAGMRARFAREARAAAGLSHPAVVAVYDTGEDAGTAYLVMERLPGETLADRMRRGPLDAGWVATIGSDVLGALGAAHAIGIVHRDIKPANVLITEDDRAKVADFGIAKAYRDDADATPGADLTATGLVLGTVAYLSPEQVDGAPATPRSDIYGLGVVLYEALAGRKPYEGANPVAQARAAHEGAAADIATVRPDLSPAFAAVVRRAMARNAADRYPSAAAMLADLERTGVVGTGAPGATVAVPAVAPTVAMAPVGADPTRVVAPAGPPIEELIERREDARRRRLAALAAVLALLVVAGIVAAVLLSRSSPNSGATAPSTTGRHGGTKPGSTTTSSTAPSTTASTLDPVTTALQREASQLESSGRPGAIHVAGVLRQIAATTSPGSQNRIGASTAELQQAQDLLYSGAITSYEYSRIVAVLTQAGGTAPSPTTSSVPPTTSAPTTTTTPSITTPSTTTTTTPSTTTTTVPRSTTTSGSTTTSTLLGG